MSHPSFPWKVFFSDLVLQLVNFEPLGGAKTDPRGKKPWLPTSRTWHVLHVTLAKHSGGMMSGLERWGLASWITHPWRPLPQKLIPFCAALGVWFSIYTMYGTVYMLLYGTVYMLLYDTVYMLCMVQYICYCMVQYICYVWYSIYAMYGTVYMLLYGTVYMLCMVQYICYVWYSIYAIVWYSICSFLSFHTKKKLAIENGLNKSGQHLL